MIPTDGSKDIVMTDKMLLTNFGHSQTLEYYKDPIDGQDYFWVAMNNKNTPSSDEYWATQIGKIQFVANQTWDYTQAPRLTNLVAANFTGKAPFSIARADGALSSTPTASRTNDGKQRLMFMTSNATDDTGSYQLSAYNVDTISAKLHASASGTVSCADLTSNLVSAHVFKPGTLEVPNKSWQGLEFADDNAVYISGGHTGMKPKIMKGNWQFTKEQTVSFSGIDDITDVETEGIQQKGNKIFVGLEFHHSNADPHRVYSISKSNFKF
ncbi:helveticin J family class III bacteriocin [Lentilactobacillus sp. Marseille-Q4993]|uniref:helveticin J family class III bacteriocin n=1 Tax=Lentilactobacillus sp. Marseille-Q4993 TaxID=3039492 RepID=UPI0024BCBC05|nr:helveticin J family class III bacteriocin [Lentilactobacillus sp. Marseille-Q4993]